MIVVAGHSKWANIKRRKEAQDNKKGARFAQCSQELIKAAKLGGADPEGNFRLRTAIERAKAAGLPSDTIQRAIDKGAGRLGADGMEDMTYEGYGPGGAAILIEAVTNNRNRTAGDIRSYFNKFNGNLGSDGCVAWMFLARGVIVVTQGLDEDTVMAAAIDAGALDVQRDEDTGSYTVITESDDLNSVCQGLVGAGIGVVSAEVTRMTENVTELTDLEHIKAFTRLMDAIEDHDDVQAVYTNASVAEALMDTLA